MDIDTSSSPSRSPVPIGPTVAGVLGLAYRARKPVLLEGPSGIGKSEMVSEVAQSLGLECRILDLSLLEPPDLVGLPVIADGVTRWARPANLPDCGAGFLVLEELNRAERHVQQPALQLLSARRLHDYFLPDGWSVVAAINPECGEYQVTPLDPALRIRFMQLRVCADRKAWLDWARRSGVHEAVVRVALVHDRLLDDVAPRTWVYVSDVLHEASVRTSADEHVLRVTLAGYLPAPWVEAVMTARQDIDTVPGLNPHHLLARYASDTETQARLASLLAEGRTDLVAALVHQIESALRDDAEASALVSRGEIDLESFERLLLDLPGDLAEKLQKAFGASPAMVALTGIDPAKVVSGYRGSHAARTVAGWLEARRKRHLAWALTTGVRLHLSRLPLTPELRRSSTFRDGLAFLLQQLGPEHGAELCKTVNRIGITLKQ